MLLSYTMFDTNSKQKIYCFYFFLNPLNFKIKLQSRIFTYGRNFTYCVVCVKVFYKINFSLFYDVKVIKKH